MSEQHRGGRPISPGVQKSHTPYPQQQRGYENAEQENGYVIAQVDPDEVEYGPEPVDNKKWACDAFAEKSRRMSFVRKVLGTVGFQLAICAAVTALCISIGEEKWIRRHFWIGIIGGIIWLGINIAVGCCRVGRGPPSFLNVSILIIGTLCLSVLCAFMATSYNVHVVLYALSTTVGILLVIIIITVFTKIDITGWGIYLMVGGIFVCLTGLVVGILYATGTIDTKTHNLIKVIIGFVFVVLLCFYILWDLQTIVGGRRFQLEEEDWLYACLMLFGDIVYLFLQLLGIYQFFERN